MTMFSSLTPAALSFLSAPSSRAEMIFWFQRAWMIPILRLEPAVLYLVRWWLLEAVGRRVYRRSCGLRLGL